MQSRLIPPMAEDRSPVLSPVSIAISKSSADFVSHIQNLVTGSMLRR